MAAHRIFRLHFAEGLCMAGRTAIAPQSACTLYRQYRQINFYTGAGHRYFHHRPRTKEALFQAMGISSNIFPQSPPQLLGIC